MSLLSVFFIGVGLSMDAFAVAICKGLSFGKKNIRKSFIVGIYFGLFQALMPLMGYLLGVSFESLIVSVDHWIAFVLLLIIGCNMIKESFNNEACCLNCSLNLRSMLPLAIATSIDALAIGITFAFLRVNIILAILIIGFTTFLLCTIAAYLGSNFVCGGRNKASLIGGIILIIIGSKILLEHLSII